MRNRALIVGITGQDGAYLSRFLPEKGYRVYGLDRRTSMPTTERLRFPEVADDVTLLDGDITDRGSLLRTLRVAQPDEVYNLAAQSFVGSSWQQAPHLARDRTGCGESSRGDPGVQRQDPILPSVHERDVRTLRGTDAIRRHPDPPSQPVCRCQALCPRDHDQLLRKLRLIRVRRNLVQSRVLHSRARLRQLENGPTEKGSAYVDASWSVEVVSLEQYEQERPGQGRRLVAFKRSHR